MKKAYLAAILAALFIVAPIAEAKGGTVPVKGYTRSNGTYVAPHNRTAPNGTKNDNWSTQGNTNPYTGQAGTKPADGGYTTPAYGEIRQQLENGVLVTYMWNGTSWVRQ